MISVILPSRGRREVLHQSVRSLLDTADNPNNIEILVAVDPDEETYTVTGAKIHVAPERWGYPLMHYYYNFLLHQTSIVSDWLLIWNDDVTMQTRGWDTIVHGRPPALLWAYCFEDVGEDVFPLIPTSWARSLGHVSASSFPNMALHEMAGQLPGRIHHIPVYISHKRVGDITRAEALQGCTPGVHNLHYSEPVQQLIREDAAKICTLIGNEFGNTQLVSVLLPGEGAPSTVRWLLDNAAQPDEVEFLVAAGPFPGQGLCAHPDHGALRTQMEELGVMGHSECHVNESTAEIRRWCNGRWVRESDSFEYVPAWDDAIRISTHM